MQSILTELNKQILPFMKETNNPFENCQYAETFSPNEIKMFHKEYQVHLFSQNEVPTLPYNFKENLK